MCEDMPTYMNTQVNSRYEHPVLEYYVSMLKQAILCIYICIYVHTLDHSSSHKQFI